MRFALAVALLCVVGSVQAEEPAREASWRVVQLDLARQMETVPFVKRYLSFAKASGYTHVQLYLEGRIRTASFPYRPDAETYSPDEIREIVAEAGRVGVELVPVVSVLGHAENFVNCPELSETCEETRAGRGRFGVNVPKMTFCTSVPETRAFLERYLTEVLALFPGKNFHMGLDESFNTGFCPRCAERMKTEGLGGIYLETIRWAHGLLARHGRRMWMWDDFFEFFPECALDVPHDVVRCVWEYGSDLSPVRGPRGRFGDRSRRDWMRLYGRNGIDALGCPGHAKQALTRFTRYADSCGARGMVFTQWEMQTQFHARQMIRARAAGIYWTRGPTAVSYDEAMDEAIATLYPSLDASARLAVRALVDNVGGAARTAALETLDRTPFRPGRGACAADPFSEAAMLDDLVTVTRISAVGERVRELREPAQGLYRTRAAVRAARAASAALQAEAKALADRRRTQEAAWRPACRPGGLAQPAESVAQAAATLGNLPEGEADASEWQVELSFLLPDYHGIPHWKFEGLYDDGWRLLGEGVWKQDEGREFAYFDRVVPFVATDAPRRLRVSYRGYNDAGLAFVAVANRAARWVPAGVRSVSGRVVRPEAVLEDTVDAAFFGDSDCRRQMLDPTTAEETAVLELDLKKE